MSKSHRKTRLGLHPLEERAVPAGIRTIDGTNNNQQHPTWGSTNTTFVRIAPAGYADGISSPTTGRPSARLISNTVADQGDDDILSRGNLSAMIYGWGQFLDHDLDLTPTAAPSQLFPIPVPTGDPYFDPDSTGTQTIFMSRSAYGSDPGVRQQVNSITAWIDGSQIYGSDTGTANSLRRFVNGKMRTSAGNLLPTDIGGFFLAGDTRVNENPELTSIQTLFVREHNRIAGILNAAHPSWTDEQIYQQARARVIAELQVITYQEWLPTLLGPNALREYHGYRPQTNPGIANEFATAGFRLGHSMLGNDIEFLNNNGLPIADEVELADAFFNPELIQEHGIDSILKYLVSDPSSEIDNTIVGGVRNFLFGAPGAGGFDLASLNIQRGRDHGLADYNTLRASYGLPRVTSFNQITANPALRQNLQSLYGNVNNIDAWVGGLAEDHVPGANTGPLIRRILVDQFERLRDGDRYWYEINGFSNNELNSLRQTRLADVIRRNTTTTNVQSNAFLFRVSLDGRLFEDRNRDGRRQLNEHGIGGRTVQLLDAADNSVVATTVTEPNGSYHFDTLNGLGVGRFRVRQVLPNGWHNTTPPIPILAYTRGDTSFGHIDFGSVRGSTGGMFVFPGLPGGIQTFDNTDSESPLTDDSSGNVDLIP